MMEAVIENKAPQRIFEKLQMVFICLFVGTLCFRRDLNQVFLIASLVCSLFLFDMQLLKQNRVKICMLILLYVVAIIWAIYSPHRNDALFVLEKQLTLLILPVVYGFSLKITPLKLRLIMGSFMLAVSGVCCYLLYIFYQAYVHKPAALPFQEFLNNSIHHFFSAPVSMHATYLSLYVCFSIAAALYLLFFEKRYYNLFALLLLPVLTASLLLLSSRIVFIPFLVILVFVTPFFLRRRVLAAYCFCLLLFVGASAYYLGKSSAFEYRLKTDTLRELNIKKQSHFMNLDSVNTNDATRAERWKCALELIRERPWTGYGTGDEKWALLEKYKKYKLTNSQTIVFDAHNQYMAFMIKSGIFGLMAWLLLLGYGFYHAFLKKNYLFICLLVIISIASLAENVLESNKGILFFAFFNTVFILYPGTFSRREEKKTVLPLPN